MSGEVTSFNIVVFFKAVEYGDIMEESENIENWHDDVSEEEDAYYPIDQYDITASPNDFNLSTIFDFIESGVVKIPGFQRNFVWDIKRASRLIESLIIGLPVPQIFLYEEGRNSFLVIDGQQRLMSVYYFMKERFPLKEKRAEIRRFFDAHGNIPDEILDDDRYFKKFKLSFPSDLSNKFKGLTYSELGDYKTAFDLRTIRNIIVKQMSPKDDDSAVYEIFNRLNTGGINLKPQEIRTSMYHSEFYNMLHRLNLRKEWRRLLGLSEPDVHKKDVEFLLRGFALLINGDKYSPSMLKFLSSFSRTARTYDADTILFCKSLFDSFLDSCSLLSDRALYSSGNRFSVTLFESVFIASCKPAIANNIPSVQGKIIPDSVSELKKNLSFQEAAMNNTTSSKNVNTRLSLAQKLIRMG